ncbi:hypothetical protein DPX16_21121 [Anabarilius grahami]|uniref:Uncharacterized protein n=1 Tax=Anabarilius grahami TaxID=495550 RepID=A0A3N0Z5G4_ANAGA|nr:hypothetical protein DPX16_21121 [Anabarilius grahami]
MDQTRPRAGLETRCPAFAVYASCPKLFFGHLVGPYAFVYGSCPCRQNQRQMGGRRDSGNLNRVHIKQEGNGETGPKLDGAHSEDVAQYPASRLSTADSRW